MTWTNHKSKILFIHHLFLKSNSVNNDQIWVKDVQYQANQSFEYQSMSKITTLETFKNHKIFLKVFFAKYVIWHIRMSILLPSYSSNTLYVINAWLHILIKRLLVWILSRCSVRIAMSNLLTKLSSNSFLVKPILSTKNLWKIFKFKKIRTLCGVQILNVLL